MPTRSLVLLAGLLPIASVQARAPDEVRDAAVAPEVLALFDYDAQADLEIEEHGVLEREDHRRIDLSYASPGGGRVPAYLYEPKSEGPHAGVLLLHGMPGSRDSAGRLAASYVRAGARVLAISAPWARPDGPREPILHFTDEDRAKQVQLVQDLRRGVDLLLLFDDVDPERLAYVGGSYGGAMGGLLAGIERRLKAYVLMVGDGGLVDHFTGPEDEPPASPELFAAWRAAMEPIEPIRFVGRAAPAELLFQNGRTDELVPAEDARRYQEAGSEPKTVFWYDSGHAITPEMLADQAAWIAERIGIDPDRFLSR